MVCSPESVDGFSGVAFVFARRLHLELKIPIGVIDCAWGGTPIEPYVPANAFKGHPTLVKIAKYAKAGDFEGIKEMPGGTYVRSPAWLPGAIYNGPAPSADEPSAASSSRDAIRSLRSAGRGTNSAMARSRTGTPSTKHV